MIIIQTYLNIFYTNTHSTRRKIAKSKIGLERERKKEKEKEI